MAFKLNKRQCKELSELVELVENHRQSIEDEQATFNAAGAQQTTDGVNKAIAAYNEHLAKLETFRESIADAWQEAWDEKSERWQDGDNGQQAQSLIDAWQEIELESFVLSEEDFEDEGDGVRRLDIEIEEIEMSSFPVDASEM